MVIYVCGVSMLYFDWYTLLMVIYVCGVSVLYFDWYTLLLRVRMEIGVGFRLCGKCCADLVLVLNGVFM